MRAMGPRRVPEQTGPFILCPQGTSEEDPGKGEEVKDA